jgi:GT2 family glycosyltransferase
VTDGVCIITPSFNPGPYLTPCLESVRAQGANVAKHIVMDGGSTDGSIEILRAHARTNPKLLWVSERDGGQSDALNKALARVDTEYFGWLNADDCYLPQGLAALVRTAAFRKTSPPVVVYGDYKVIDSGSRVIKQRRQPSFNYKDCLYSYLTVQNCAAIFRTNACRASGGFDRNLHFCMDYELVLRLARTGPVEHVREYVGCFRHHAGAKTSQIPEVCESETRALRAAVSGLSDAQLRTRYWISKSRVLLRMALEGCIGSRLGRPRGDEIIAFATRPTGQ